MIRKQCNKLLKVLYVFNERYISYIQIKFEIQSDAMNIILQKRKSEHKPVVKICKPSIVKIVFLAVLKLGSCRFTIREDSYCRNLSSHREI